MDGHQELDIGTGGYEAKQTAGNYIFVGVLNSVTVLLRNRRFQLHAIYKHVYHSARYCTIQERNLFDASLLVVVSILACHVRRWFDSRSGSNIFLFDVVWSILPVPLLADACSDYLCGQLVLVAKVAIILLGQICILTLACPDFLSCGVFARS